MKSHSKVTFDRSKRNLRGFTGRYLDDAADLVGCPPGTDPGLFAFTYTAREVARLDGWYLFSVPRR